MFKMGKMHPLIEKGTLPKKRNSKRATTGGPSRYSDNGCFFWPPFKLTKGSSWFPQPPGICAPLWLCACVFLCTCALAYLLGECPYIYMSEQYSYKYELLVHSGYACIYTHTCVCIYIYIYRNLCLRLRAFFLCASHGRMYVRARVHPTCGEFEMLPETEQAMAEMGAISQEASTFQSRLCNTIPKKKEELHPWLRLP